MYTFGGGNTWVSLIFIPGSDVRPEYHAAVPSLNSSVIVPVYTNGLDYRISAVTNPI